MGSNNLLPLSSLRQYHSGGLPQDLGEASSRSRNEFAAIAHNLLARLLPLRPRLAEEEKARLQLWRSGRRPDTRLPFEQSRYVVVDVETGGLNPAKDRLIAIGAVAVVAGRIQITDSFEAILRQEAASTPENILIHGIGGTAQREGIPPVKALLDFLDYLDSSPLVAFNVAFDETAIKTGCRKFLGLQLKWPWLDLAFLAPALYPEIAHVRRSLDDWTGQFKINNYSRHSALADALSTAQLFLVLLNKSRQHNSKTFAHLMDHEQAQRWVKWVR